jgi:hypothetical protein
MFNNGLLDSSLFCCILLLCLPHCLPAHMTCAVCSSAIYTLCTMSLQFNLPLLCISTPALCLLAHTSILLHSDHNNSNNNGNNNPISSLYRVLIASVHLVHAMCTIPLHTHTAPISSTSLVLCLIIMVTLQLLWQFSHAFSITGCYAEIPQPLWKLRLFVFSGIVELILSVSITGSNPIQLSISSTNHLHSTGRFLVTLQLLWKSHKSLFTSSGRNHQWFLAVTL